MSATKWQDGGGAAVTVLGRTPEPGRVKTRLAASLGEHAACEIHEALALDVLARLRAWLDARPEAIPGGLVLALTGDEAAGRALETAARERFGARIERQSGGGLGDRIREALDRRADEGAAGSLVVGTDAPLLDDALLDAAVATLAAGRTGLSPSTDGGFVLLAARRVPEACFEGVPWGQAGVLGAVNTGLERAGLRPERLPGSEDVDEEADLLRLAVILSRRPELAPATARRLARRPEPGQDG
jgi:rSAM/selenodomain-associated transferase 1